MRVIWYTFLNLICLISASTSAQATPETPEARHLRQRIEQLKSIAAEKATLDSQIPASEQKLSGGTADSKPPLQVDSKTEDDGDVDEKDQDGKTGMSDKRTPSDENGTLALPNTPKIPPKKIGTPVPPRVLTVPNGNTLPVRPGMAQPTIVFPAN